MLPLYQTRQKTLPMKKHIIAFFFFAIPFLSVKAQQTFTCNQAIIVFSEAICSGDSLRYTVTVTGDINCSATAFGIPVNTVVIADGGSPQVILDGQLFISNLDLIQFIVPGCGPVPMLIDFASMQGCDACTDITIVIDGGLAIPTLGQWGLITLSLLLFIFGLVKLRSGFISPVIRT